MAKTNITEAFKKKVDYTKQNNILSMTVILLEYSQKKRVIVRMNKRPLGGESILKFVRIC